MDQEDRQLLHQLVVRALDKDAVAPAAIERMILDAERSGAVDDVVEALELLSIWGLSEVHGRIIAQLYENDSLGGGVFGTA
jgi:hypothetical protein